MVSVGLVVSPVGRPNQQTRFSVKKSLRWRRAKLAEGVVVNTNISGIRRPGMMSGRRIMVTRFTQLVEVDMRESGTVLNISQSVRQVFKTNIGIDARILLRVVLRPEVRVEHGAIDLLCNHKHEKLSEGQSWLVLKASGRLPLRHESGVRPLLHVMAVPNEMQKAADRSRGRIADHSNDVGVAVAILEEPLALMAITLRVKQFFVTIIMNPIAIRERLIEQAILGEEPLQHRRATALCRPENGNGKPRLLKRKDAMIRAGRTD